MVVEAIFLTVTDGGVILSTAIDDSFVQCDLFVYLWDSKNNGTQKTLSIESTGKCILIILLCSFAARLF